MELIKPVSVQWMWIARAVGESAFRLLMLTAPTAVVIALIFPVRRPASGAHFSLFAVAVAGGFLLMASRYLMYGRCAVPLQAMLAVVRAASLPLDIPSCLIMPDTFSPEP